MRPLSRLAVTVAATVLAATTATAETVGLGTTQGGGTAQIANAIAQVGSQFGDGLQVRPHVLANTSQYIPLVNEGSVEFGIANLPQASYAVSGTGMSEGRPNPNLRMVAALFPFNAGLVATKESGIVGYADLEGKRVPAFPEGSLGDFIIRASLQAGGLGYADVERVPIANFPKQFQAFKDGQIDAAIAAVGSKPTIDFDASISGGIRFLTLKDGDLAAIRKWLPGAELRTLPDGADLPGMTSDTVVFAYDYTLFANKDVADEAVYKLVKALHDHPSELRATSPLWAEYDPSRIAKDVGIPYHTGALEFFAEVGLKGGS